MPNNAAVLKALDEAGLVNSTVAGEVIREIDLGEYADSLQGQKLQVCVNMPGVLDETLRAPYQEMTRDKMIAALAVMTGVPPAAWAGRPDTLIHRVFSKAYDYYWEYDGELRKNSPTHLSVTSTPSTPTPTP